MTSKELKTNLNFRRLNKERIDELVQELSCRPELTSTLLEEVFTQDAAVDSFNASWVFDHLMRKKLDLILPLLDRFVRGTTKLKTESCMRPMAHVLEMLNKEYFEKNNPLYKKTITDEHHGVIIETCFDWLIGNHKVATKIFAMTSLFYLGEKYDWVRPELKSVLELQIVNGTAGFKNRGGKVLNHLKNLGY